jgi:hypothetical protein
MTSLPAWVAAALAIPVGVSTSWPLAGESRGDRESELGILIVRAIDGQGRPLLARARLQPASTAERVRLRLWDDVQAIAGPRGARIRLREGAYRLWLSHGPEWSLASELLQLKRGALLARTIVLTHQVSLPGFCAADLHVHTARSKDAQEAGGVSGAALRAEGIELAAATDHNQIGRLDGAVDSVAGAEVTTWDPEVGHFNAFPLERIPTWRGTTSTRCSRSSAPTRACSCRSITRGSSATSRTSSSAASTANALQTPTSTSTCTGSRSGTGTISRGRSVCCSSWVSGGRSSLAAGD